MEAQFSHNIPKSVPSGQVSKYFLRSGRKKPENEASNGWGGVRREVIKTDNGKKEVTHYCKNYPHLDSNVAG